MAKIGLLAGEGILPVEFTRSAKGRGEKVVVFAVRGMASPLLDKEADKVYWLEIGQFARFAFLLLKERVKRIAFLGKIRKETIYDEAAHDTEAQDVLRSVRNKKDYTILRSITDRLAMIGIAVIDTTGYLTALIPGKGVLGKAVPDAALEEDIAFGYSTAKKLAEMDIGQTVIVKGKSVVAVEAMEGTDDAIERGNRVAGPGCVMVKVSRPGQDMRWDIPTVGAKTMDRLIEYKYKAMAIESGRMYLLQKEKVLERADAAGIVVEAL